MILSYVFILHALSYYCVVAFPLVLFLCLQSVAYDVSDVLCNNTSVTVGSQSVNGQKRGSPTRHPNSLKRALSNSASDPYIFEEEMVTTNGITEAFKREVDIKDEVKNGNASPNSPALKKSESLFTSEGLQASLSDLDKIFATDSPVDDVSATRLKITGLCLLCM